MSCSDQTLQTRATVRTDEATVFVALELSHSTWLVAASLPGSDKMSKHGLKAGDGPGLLALLARFKAQAERQVGGPVRIVTIQEAGLDGFWLHRLLEANGVDSQVVDPASIQVSRRRRRAKTDRIDVEGLLRTVMAWARGERRVCSMVRPPSPEVEDARRPSRQRQALLKERVRHVNRIKGLLSGQGVFDYEPLHRDRRERLEAVRTGDGRALPPHLKAEILCEITLLEVVLGFLSTIEAQRDARVQAARAGTDVPGPKAGPVADRQDGADGAAAVAAAGMALETVGAAGPDEVFRSGGDPAAASTRVIERLMRLKGIGPEIATVLGVELFYRQFDNRRQIAAYAGVVPSPFKSGGTDHEQGISKAGNPRVRHALGELAWLWVRHQPGSKLSQWFRARVGEAKGRIRRILITAVARKLLVALWHYITEGVLPEGAILKTVT
jgi:transposase